MIEKIGGSDGTRTRDLWRDRPQEQINDSDQVSTFEKGETAPIPEKVETIDLEDVLSIYDGQEHLGDLATVPDGFLAFDQDGTRIGSFASRQQAERAITAEARARS